MHPRQIAWIWGFIISIRGITFGRTQTDHDIWVCADHTPVDWDRLHYLDMSAEFRAERSPAIPDQPAEFTSVETQPATTGRNETPLRASILRLTFDDGKSGVIIHPTQRAADGKVS